MPDNPEIWKAVAMADHFEKIQKLPDPIPGVPNFRRVPGYKVPIARKDCYYQMIIVTSRILIEK